MSSRPSIQYECIVPEASSATATFEWGHFFARSSSLGPGAGPFGPNKLTEAAFPNERQMMPFEYTVAAPPMAMGISGPSSMKRAVLRLGPRAFFRLALPEVA